MNKLKQILLLIKIGILMLLVTACSNGADEDNLNIGSSSVAVNGGITKGPLVGANVTAYLMLADGSADLQNAVASAITDSSGLFTLQLPVDRGYLVVKSSGGEFVDESHQTSSPELRRRIILAAGDGLTALLSPTMSQLSLTLVTQAVFEKTLREFKDDFVDTYETNLTNFEQGFGFNPLATLAANPLAPAAQSSTAQLQYALIAGGLANLINEASISAGLAEPTAESIMAVALDFSDGIFDGMASGEPVMFLANGQSVAIKNNLNLDLAIERFRNNNSAAYPDVALPVVDYSSLTIPGRVNQLPTVIISGPTSLASGAVLTLDANAADSDGTIASYLWTQTGGPDLGLGSVSVTGPSLSLNAPVVASDTAYTFTVTVTDDEGAQAVASHTTSVTPPPLLSVSISGDTTVVSNGSGSVTGSTDSVPLVSVASVMWSESTSIGISFTAVDQFSSDFNVPTISSPVTATLVFTVTDNLGRQVSATHNVDIIVSPPPIVDAGVDQTVREFDTVSLSGTASDPDGSVVSQLWGHSSGLDITIADASSLNTTFVAPDVSVTTVVTFVLTATDDAGGSGSDSVDITIQPYVVSVSANATPATVKEQDSVSLSASASPDTGRSIVSVQWSEVTSLGLTLSTPNTLNSGFTAPNVSSDTTATIQFTATDDLGNQGSTSVNVLIQPNSPPQLTVTPTQTVNAGDPVSISVSVVEPEGESYTVIWKQILGPITPVTGILTEQIELTAPTVSATKTLNFEVKAVDDFGKSSTAVASVIVNPSSNQPPTVTGFSDAFVAPGSTIGFTVGASDPDGTISAYFWEQLSTVQGSIDDNTSSNIIFTAPSVSVQTIVELKVTVTDDQGATAFTVFSVIVDPSPVLITSLVFSDAALANCVNITASVGGYSFAYQMVALDCSTQGITDLSGIEGLFRLNQASFINNSISNVSPLASLTDLEGVLMEGNPVTNFESLADSVSLKLLGANNTNLTDLNMFSNFRLIIGLDVADNPLVSDLTPLANFNGLQLLDVSNTAVTDLSTVANFPVLEFLYMDGLDLTDIGFVSSLTNLKRLKLNSNLLTNISAVSGLVHLEELELEANMVVSISSLAALVEMKKLILTNNLITDATGISAMAKIEEMWFGSNDLNDLTPFFGLTTLTSLNFANNDNIDCTELQTLADTLVGTTITPPGHCTLASPGTLIWAFISGGAITGSPAKASDGDLLFTSRDGNLYKYNNSGTGSVFYTDSGAAAIEISPAVGSDGSVFYGDQSAKVFAINADGSRRWVADLSVYSGANGIKTELALLSNDDVIVSTANMLFRLSGVDGSVVAGPFFTANGEISAAAIDSSNNIFIGTSYGFIYRVDQNLSVETMLDYNNNYGITGAPSIGGDGSVYFGDNSGNLVALTVGSSLTLQWSFASGGPVYTSPVMGINNEIIFGSDDGKVYAINSSGSLIYSFTTSGAIRSTPAVTADGSIIFGSNDHCVYSISATGSANWTVAYNTGNTIASSPLIDNDGKVFIGGDNNKFMAIAASNGALANTPWATLMANNNRTGNSAFAVK